MRKSLVIGAIAAVVIGVAAYMLSPPRKGTVEWHEREYWVARRGKSDVLVLIQLALGMESVTSYSEEDVAKMMAHEAALIRRGRLVERVVLVSNQPPDKVLRGALPAIAALGPMKWESDVVFFEGAIRNGIRLVTRTNDAAARLSRLEALIRQADVPQSK